MESYWGGSSREVTGLTSHLKESFHCSEENDHKGTGAEQGNQLRVCYNDLCEVRVTKFIMKTELQDSLMD